MKKIILSITFSAITMCVFAQLRVNADGNVSVKRNIQNEYALLGVGEEPAAQNGLGYCVGIRACETNSVASKSCIGVWGFAQQNGYTSYPFDSYAAGVCGSGWGEDGAQTYGVLGYLANNSNGAGIFGSNFSEPFYSVTGSYAGFFDGPTYVYGNLTATSICNLSDMRLKRNIVSLRDKPSLLNNILGLNTIEYNLINKNEKKDSIRNMKNTDWNRRHYGLSAQELQSIYPDLVYEGQDGYLSVNYVELVPILIRSIQELNEKIEQLNAEKGGAEYKTRSISDENADFNAAATGNVLYQNTPNPFKEQTTIRFRLAENATNAAICIFDMSGKMLKKLPVSQGMTSVTVNGYELGEGMFLYTLLVNGMEIDTKRMIVTK